ncbi:uncharacterized protein J3R85_017170 [Psidium guajava]|nr:uncharacterized protein J3R85_017170 [Psidium guajava]
MVTDRLDMEIMPSGAFQYMMLGHWLRAFKGFCYSSGSKIVENENRFGNLIPDSLNPRSGVSCEELNCNFGGTKYE